MLNLKTLEKAAFAFLITTVCLAGIAGAQNPDILVKLSDGQAFGGGSLSQSVHLDNMQTVGIQGWSLGVCNDPASLIPSASSLGSDATTIKNGDMPDFETMILASEAVTQGVVICFTGCATLGEVTDFELLQIDYDVLGEVGSTTDLQFCSYGSPLVTTVMVINGESVAPSAQNSTIDILSPNFLTIGSGFGIVGQEASTPVSVSTERPIDGLSIAAGYDVSLLTFLGATASGTAIDADFVEVSQTSEPGTLGVGLVMSFSLTNEIPVGDDQEIMLLNFSVANDLGGQPAPLTTSISFIPSSGQPPITNRIVDGSYSETPNLVDGSIELVDFNPFVRGDCNRDSSVDIADGIAILAYLFQSQPVGGSSGPCLDACDVDDSAGGGNPGIGIGDAVYVFTYQFAGGSPPPAPFPSLGIDPTTGDGIGCDGDADDS
ncbi:MAG: hypothetical protein CBC13_08940 [Planctomycetia bacterium TMED53]|nr:MAG: hypothetical protein CBC13_08940 [Planctomycetia bacterium TMED53]